MDSSLLNMISAFMEIALILFFVIAILGLLLAARRGYKKGVYKSTYMMVGLAMFFVLAIITMKPITRMVFNLPISSLFDNNPAHVNFAIGEKTIEFDLTISTVEGTLTDFVTGFCREINATEALNVNINQFAKTVVFSFLSIIAYIVDFDLIVGMGYIFLQIMWVAFFKKLTPKICERLGKIKFIGMAEGMVTYLVLMFMFMAPLTSLVNAINQGVQKSDARNSQNETVKEIVRLVDIYNDSLFAQAFFNWNTAFNSSGTTIDQGIINFFSTSLNDGVDAISLSKEIGNLTYAVGQVASCLGTGENGEVTITEFSENLITPVFDLIGQSDLFNSLFQISMELTLNTDVLDGVIPNYEYFEKVDISKISLEEEIEVFKGMANDIIDSQILDDFISREGDVVEFNPPENIIDYLDDLFTLEKNREKVNKIFNVLKRIDDFKLLRTVLDSLGYWAVTLDESKDVLKFLGGNVEIDEPYKDANNKALVVDFIHEFNIGSELYTIFDACWGLAGCGDHVIKNAYNSFRGQLESETLEEYEAQKRAAKSALANTLKAEQTTTNFRDAICGANHMKADGTAEERDSTKGEHYALLDSKILTKFINETPFMRNLLDNLDLKEKYGDGYEEAESRWNALMDEVFDENASALPIKFFKNEINDILLVVTNVIQLELPTSSSSATPAPRKARLNAEENDSEDASKPFEYKDYSCFVEAAVNLFDGWVNSDDVLGSMLDLDSRIAPYLGKAFECLIPLDNSRIVKALGIPYLNARLSSARESTQDYFDIDICIEQIKKSNDVFAQIAAFIDSGFITDLQHFYKGFLVNDEGKFDTAALTDLIQDDINGFFKKFNEYVEITPDNPDTTENEQKFDTHPLKYYFSDILKRFYNFELFNPHSGVYKNKNMEHLFDFVFGNMESFGVEKPNNDVYAKLNGDGKWEAELDAISNIFGVIGENNMLKFADYSSDLSSTLLYSLAGDTATASTLDGYASDMPKNLGQVLSSIGDSVLLSSVMGGLLDSNLNGSLCETTIGVSYENVSSGDYWHQEGENMSDLLLTIAQLDLDLQNLDFTKVTDVVGMNEMLHKLSDSLIFRNETNGNMFGEWLERKVNTAMDSMSEGLLDDPDVAYWDSSWDTTLDLVDNTDYPTQKIAHYDFLVRDGNMPSDYAANKAGWNSTDYKTLMASFKDEIHYDTLTKAEKDELYKEPGFIDNYYDKVLKYDEIGRVVNVMANGIKIMDGNTTIDFSNLSAENMNDFLTSVNNTNCLRIASYNAMNLAKDNVGSNDFADINKAQFEYMILADADLTSYDTGRINRQEEIDNIIKFYSNYKEIQNIAGDNLDSSSFFNKAKLAQMLGVDSNGNNNPFGTDYLTNLLAGLQGSHCFNLETVENRSADELSFFEDMMKNLIDKSGLIDLADSNELEMEARIRTMSNLDFDGITVNPNGYNTEWASLDGAGNVVGGEIDSLSKVFKSVIGATSGDTIEADSISITDLPASGVTRIMSAVNGSYLCTGVMNHFVKDAFEGELGLNKLLRYNDPDDPNEVPLANFDLTYTDYGGSDINNQCIPGTEIYNFYKVIDAMQYEDNITHKYEFVSMEDFSDAISKKPDCLDGVFYFLYNSKTLDKTDTPNTIEIRARSLMLYNALENFQSYLIGNDKDNKIDSIEKIFTLTDSLDPNAYLIEANGITKIIKRAGNRIDGITVDNLRDEPDQKAMILDVIEYTYDRDDGGTGTAITNARAYFASEIVSGIFDDVLNTEYTDIVANYASDPRLTTFEANDVNKFYFAQKNGGGKATCANDITATTFDNLCEVERKGIDGLVEMTKYVNGEAGRGGTDLSNVDTNPFIVAVTSHSSEMNAIFQTKFHSEGRDSRIAKVIYISRVAQTIEKESRTADDTDPINSGLLVMLKYAINVPTHLTSNPSDYIWKDVEGYEDDYYAASFGFDTYGTNLINYINSCTEVQP